MTTVYDMVSAEFIVDESEQSNNNTQPQYKFDQIDQLQTTHLQLAEVQVTEQSCKIPADLAYKTQLMTD